MTNAGFRENLFFTQNIKKKYDINKEVQKKSLKKTHKDYAEFFSNINLNKKSF